MGKWVGVRLTVASFTYLGHYSYRKRDNSNNKYAPDFIPVSSNTSLTAVSPTIEINEKFKKLCNNVALLFFKQLMRN